MPVPFATNGQRTDIIAATISGSNQASYPDGFPSITMLDESAGGVPPLGQNFNQILFELASAMRWSNVGGLYPYDSTFSTSVGGYPAGARVIGSDNRTIYVSLTDDNTDDPTSGTGTWFNESIGQLPVGVPIPYPSSTVPSGFLACDGSAFPSTYTTLATLYPSLKTPDLRGYFIRGWDNGAGIDSGRTLLSTQADSIVSHNHTLRTTSSPTNPTDIGDPARGNIQGSVNTAGGLGSGKSIGMTGDTETRPKNIAFNYILRAF